MLSLGAILAQPNIRTDGEAWRDGMVEPKDSTVKVRVLSCRTVWLQRKRANECLTPHSHSIILSDVSALIFRRNFSGVRESTVSPIRQNFALLISKGNFGDSRFARFNDYRHRSADFRSRPPT
jgi:hypothetical protein